MFEVLGGISWFGAVCMSFFLAAAKNRSRFAWVVWSIIFGPVALLALIGAPSLSST